MAKKRKLIGKEDTRDEEAAERLKRFQDELKKNPNGLKVVSPRKPREKRDKLEKAELLQLMKAKGKESIDSDHEALIKYIFPKNDLTPQENRNKNYTRRRILTALDLILAYCDVYPKKDVKK